jgi:hypothetical protein
MPSAWDLIHWIAMLAMAAAIGASSENLIAVPEEMTLPESTRLPWPTA